VFRVGIDQVKE
jgi:hypothetical protein